MPAHFGIEGLRKQREVGLGQGQPRRHGVAAVLGDQVGVLAGDDRQRIADMKALHRASRALEQAITGIGEGDGRAEITLLHA